MTLFDSKRAEDGRINGVVVGIVTNNQDPDKLGRVKVMIPRISGDDESNWARVCTFMAGNDRGAFFLPEVDDEVLVAFEHGDINSPYVIGCLWNGKDSLPSENSSGGDDIRIIKSRSGHIVILDDTQGGEKIKIQDKSGEMMISFETTSKKVTVKSGKDIELSASSGKVSISANEIEIKGSGKVDIKGAQINLN